MHSGRQHEVCCDDRGRERRDIMVYLTTEADVHNNVDTGENE